MFVLGKHNTSLAVPGVFISAILLILRRIYSFDRRLILWQVFLINVELIIVIYDLLLHAYVCINLGSAIIVLICQKVGRLILVG